MVAVRTVECLTKGPIVWCVHTQTHEGERRAIDVATSELFTRRGPLAASLAAMPCHDKGAG